jgi:hypothetical protein
MADHLLGAPCTYWVDTPDITTARCVYGYAC